MMLTPTPFQQGSSLNAAGINYNSLQAMQAMKRLKALVKSPGADQLNLTGRPVSFYEEAKQQGWIVISMKNDWKRIFAFDERSAAHTKDSTIDNPPMNDRPFRRALDWPGR